MQSNEHVHDGGCSCGHVRYRMNSQPWVALPPEAVAVDEYSITEEVWSDGSLERRTVLAKAVKNQS